MEIEGPEHAHAPHTTGFRWLDISLALSAFLISLTSLALAIHNGSTMEKLVTSNSYPNIDADHSNLADLHDGLGLRRILSVQLSNNGIGPARVRALEVFYEGKPVRDLPGLLDLCCAHTSGALPELHYFYPGDLRGSMIQAGKSRELFQWPEAPGDPRWSGLNANTSKIDVRVCYCSVFDECYLHDGDKREPERVKVCPVPAVSYIGQ